jgi:hypothetical protein
VPLRRAPKKKEEANDGRGGELILRLPDPPLARQHYGLGVVTTFCRFVLEARTSLAGASAVLAVICPELAAAGEIPHPTTGRAWLLRLGLYKLQEAAAPADDWVWLVDHVVQIGTAKCLMIAGLRLCDLPPPGQCLELKHLQPLAILPVEQSHQERVQQQLEGLAVQTGAPRAIVSDEGTDLRGGIQRFQQAHPDTACLSDIAHFGARRLKRRLEKNARWQAFVHQVGQTKFETAQTELGFLTPPRQRSKARFLNLDGLLSWATNTLAVLDQRPAAVLQYGTVERLEVKFGWLREFRAELREWSEWQALAEAAMTRVRGDGYHAGAAEQVEADLRPLVRSPTGAELSTELVAFVAQQSAVARAGERLPGSSEILESSFGKWKAMEGEHAKGGFTQLVLGYAALLGETTSGLIGRALEATPMKQVTQWCGEHLGVTLQAKRTAAYRSVRPPTAQQKSEET